MKNVQAAVLIVDIVALARNLGHSTRGSVARLATIVNLINNVDEYTTYANAAEYLPEFLK